jgi:hypothetical protein
MNKTNINIEITDNFFGNVLLVLTAFFLILLAIKYQCYWVGIVGFIINQFKIN